MTQRCVLGAMLFVLLIAVPGCGGGGDSELDEAVAGLETASQGATPGTTRDVTAPGLIRNYFDLIDAKRFADAWSVLELDVQEEFGGFEAWREGYATNTSTEVLEAEVTSTAGEETDLTVHIRATDSCSGERIEQEYEGTWSVDVKREKITEAEFAQTTGEPVPSDC